jgi:hypothetical protein
MAAATVKSTTAMEPTAAAVKSTANRAARDATAMCEPASSSESGPTASCKPASTYKPASSTKARSASYKPASAETPTEAGAPEEAAASKSVEPGTRSNEHAASKPVRPVVTVRRARIRVIAVIPVFTNRTSIAIAAVHGPNSDTHTNLCLGRRRCWKNANRSQ